MLSYSRLRMGLSIARVLPFSVVAALGAGMGMLMWLLSPARRTVAQNLRQMEAAGASPTPASKVYTSYGRYWGELLSLAAKPSRLDKLRIQVEGLEKLRAAAEAAPVCVLSAHLGNWDLLAFWIARHLGGFTVAVEELRPPRLFRLFREMRESGGLTVVAADGGGRALFRSVKDGQAMGLVADRVVGKGSRPAGFMRGVAEFPSAGMDLARRAGAQLVPMFLVRRNGGYVITVHSPLPEEDDPVTSWARVLEQEVLAAPGQYCVLCPLLPSTDTENAVTEDRRPTAS